MILEWLNLPLIDFIAFFFKWSARWLIMEWKRSRWHKKLRCSSGSLETQRENIWRNTKTNRRVRTERESGGEQMTTNPNARVEEGHREAQEKLWEETDGAFPPPHKQHTSSSSFTPEPTAPDTSYSAAPGRPAPPLTALTPQGPLALYAPVLSALATSVPRWPDMNDTHYGEKDFTAWGAAL